MPANMTPQRLRLPFSFSNLEHRHEKLISPRDFLHRMLRAIGVWCALALFGLIIGMAGYCYFETHVASRRLCERSHDPLRHGATRRTQDYCRQALRRLLRNLLGAHYRDRHVVCTRSYFSSCTASLSCRGKRERIVALSSWRATFSWTTDNDEAPGESRRR